MVARINSSREAGRIIRYNERKVEREAAELIHAANFFAEPDALTYPEKLRRFQFLNEQRPDVKLNMLHISLNFQPREQLENSRMASIADRYMAGIGLADQPYLVYRHNDLDRPHLHIVTNIIEPGGHRIRTHNLGKDKSEPTRKAIEREFGLIPEPPSRQRAGISKTIEEIWNRYRFTSLEEYNALLRRHQLKADPGVPGHHDHHGLLYHRLGGKGQPTGMPIRASDLPFHPTLRRLEEKFSRDQTSRKADIHGLRKKLDWARSQSLTTADFADELQKQSVELYRQRLPGRDSIIYIDHENGAAIGDRALGVGYSFPALIRSFSLRQGHRRTRDLDQEPGLD